MSLPCQPHILVADDEASIRRLLQTVLEARGYRVTVVEDGLQAAACLEREKVDVAILDIRMPGENGLDLFRRMKPDCQETAFILITAYGTVRTAIEAMKAGAFDYVTKPFLVDEVEVMVERALEVGRLTRELDRLKRKVDGQPGEQLIGQSPAMQKVFKVVGRVAPADAAVLIQGESGTGKEIVAGLLHHYSLRREGPLIKVNCAALPEGLLESELFGYERGAFTGAARSKPGKLEMAHMGTVFLDEVGDLPLSLQAKLLRVLQEKEIDRLGGVRTIPVDIRVVAATNRNLMEAVHSGQFREDLFYRLNVVNIILPPLRDRAGDIPLLAEFFVQKYAARMNKGTLLLAPETLALLESHHWPGNVRELENTIERAVILASGPVIRPEHLPDEFLEYMEGREGGPGGGRIRTSGTGGERGNAAAGRTVHHTDEAAGRAACDSPCFREGPLPTLRQAIQQVERQLIAEALRRTGGNKSRTARILDISRRALQYKMEAYGLEKCSG
ncbi:response regulator [Desulfofundulus thermobenzoicus]|uniref:Stage 0 sporulation protein A homolog n=2 Tax=Desulfofundulus thermobenzoicus TaxID=29376 RepID=A0A6N7IUX9_9FIRM|nr:response regulator [Desulfofundulus thermobenzoicus]